MNKFENFMTPNSKNRQQKLPWNSERTAFLQLDNLLVMYSTE